MARLRITAPGTGVWARNLGNTRSLLVAVPSFPSTIALGYGAHDRDGNGTRLCCPADQEHMARDHRALVCKHAVAIEHMERRDLTIDARPNEPPSPTRKALAVLTFS